MAGDTIHIYRGEVLSFNASPFECAEAYTYYTDGALLVADGKVVQTGPFSKLQTIYKDVPVTDYSGRLIMPGFIDTHIHYAQSAIIGMYGRQLLDWLNEYTYPAEQDFVRTEHAQETARFFVRELLRNGTTTCVAYATVHPVSVSALFAVASEYDMCMLTGKVLMDRSAPDSLTDAGGNGIDDSRTLLERWHRQGRNYYVITPRFAITSTMGQLREAGRLHAEYSDTYIQTHLSETPQEIASVLSLHLHQKDYLEVYEAAGLLTDRTVFGHCVHISHDELRRMYAVGGIISHCPTSNLFLGSGLFDMKQADQFGVQTTLGTDVGAGTSFSMLRTMGEAYKVQQLQGYSISAFDNFYKSTLGAARALKLDDRIGSFHPGCEADFIVLDYASTPSQRLRADYLLRNDKWSLENKLFGLQTLGDDRAVVATYLRGREVAR